MAGLMEVPFARELNWPNPLVPFDALDIRIQHDPFPYWEWMRENAPIIKAPTPTADLFFVSRYEDVQIGFRTFRKFSNATVNPDILPFIMLTDPPQHSRIRQGVAYAFTPKAVARLEENITALAAKLFEPILVSGGGEIFDGFATPLTMATIGGFLDMPADMFSKLADWTTDTMNYFGRIARHIPRASATDC